MLVLDSGPIIAAANRRDKHYLVCRNLIETYRDPLLLPMPILSEIGYMLETRVGSSAESDFLRDIADGVYTLIPVTDADVSRAADLIDRYSNLPLGTADAFVIAVAERLRIRDIGTVDRTHFEIVKPKHVSAFNLLPEANSG